MLKSNKDDRWILVASGIGAVALWGANWYFLQQNLTKAEERGQFGDMFGSVNALFTALAFAGLIYTAVLQRRQLDLQTQELSEAKATQEKLVQDQIASQSKLLEEQMQFQQRLQDQEVKHQLKLEGLRQDFQNIVEERRRDRDREKENAFVGNLLRALRYELEAISGFYHQGIGKHLADLADGQILPVRFALSEDWLTVYANNAGHLGRVEGELSRQIITVYTLVKALMEEYRINNAFLEELGQLKAAIDASTAPPDIEHRAQRLMQLAVDQAARIRKTDSDLKTEYARLITELNGRSIN